MNYVYPLTDKHSPFGSGFLNFYIGENAVFNNSKVSTGKSRVTAIHTYRDDHGKICRAKVTFDYIPYKSNKVWKIVAELPASTDSKEHLGQMFDYMFRNRVLETELVGLGSFIPLIDTVRHALGFHTINISWTRIHKLHEFMPSKVTATTSLV